MKKLLLALILSFFAFSANAKVTVMGTPLEEKHINVIKGHFYDYSKTAGSERFVLTAKSLKWILKLDKDKKTHEIVTKKYKKDMRAKMVITAINFYSEVENGKYLPDFNFYSEVENGKYLPDLSKEHIYVWHELGKRVVVTQKKGVWTIKLK